MNRFFVEPIQVGNDAIKIWDNADIKHMGKVLRLKPGDKIEISDSAEFEYVGEIISMDREEVVARILNKQAFRGEPNVKVTLFQCVPKQGKMETIIQKSVELGVHKIVPVFCDRTLVRENRNNGRASKIERWNRVSAEAVKQCKRGLIPAVEEAIKIKEMAELLGGFDLILFPYENENGTTMKTVLRKESETMNIALIIGPEGGFSDEEAALIKEKGGKALSLGRTVLRTETAGPAALAMIMYELEL